MSLLTQRKYSFISHGVDKETFTVVSFKGFEAISQPYEFEIILVSDKSDIDPLNVLQNPAMFTIHRDREENVDFNGILMQFEETQEYDGFFFFRAVLSPKFWWLSLTHHNQVFLDLNVQEIMEEALKDGGLVSGIDFEFQLQNSYDKREYVCQYDESHFDFVSRWAQREGIYYFFEQTSSGEKLVFTDTKISHKDLLLGKDLDYEPQSGLDALHTKEVVKTFLCRHNLLPQRVYLKDYNYLKPSLAIEGIADVDENGRGENYVYGVHFDTPEEGNRLASIRAEALLCRKSEFNGESSVPFMVPGYTFDLKDHYKEIYNRKYLVTDVTHEGHQAGYLVSGISAAVEPRDEQMFYVNTFTSIYSDEQFRPEHITQKPRISGTINAKIDASSSGQHAELDEHGRYKVILPFDRSGRFNGKASAWFRMMQPSAGSNRGMHFPLHKGTEVLLTFIDGNPDRPVIAGAMPNPETASPVTSGNQTRSVITTGKSPVDHSAGAAEFVSTATSSGTQNIGYTDQSDNYIEFEDLSGSERIRIHSDKDIWQEAQNRFAEYAIGVPAAGEARPTEISNLIGTMYDFSTAGFAPTGVEIYKDEPPYSETITLTSGASTTSWASPAGTATTDQGKWQFLVNRGKVKVAKGDTFNVQEGNVYDFGGYWVYNLGNSYIENHMYQAQNGRKAVLNETIKWDLLNTGGPHWSSFGTLTPDTLPKPGASGFHTTTNELDAWGKGEWTNGKVWVEKKFGDSYDYTEGNNISIQKGNSQTIIIGGRTVEEKYGSDGTGGYVKRRFYKSGGGESWEKKWTKTGMLLSDAWTYTTGANHEIKNNISYNYGAKTNLSWDFASNASLAGQIGAFTDNKIYLGAKWTTDIKVAADGYFNFWGGGKSGIDISVGVSPICIEFSAVAKSKIGIGTGFDFNAYWNPAWKMDVINDGWKLQGPFTEFKKEKDLKAEIQKLIIQDAKLHLESQGIEMKKKDIEAAKAQLTLKESYLFHV